MTTSGYASPTSRPLRHEGGCDPAVGTAVYRGELPVGDYVVVEEELLQGLSFEACRRTATFLTVCGTGSRAARTEMRAKTESDLKEVLSRDQAVFRITMTARRRFLRRRT